MPIAHTGLGRSNSRGHRPLRVFALIAAVAFTAAACSGDDSGGQSAPADDDGEPSGAETSSCATTPDEELAGLGEEILATATSTAQDNGATAMLISVRRGGDDVVTAATGESLAGIPATTDDRFRNGAVAISYLATVMLQLDEEGVLDIDEPIATLGIDLPNADQVTPRMLVNGTSGYRDYVPDPVFLDELAADPFRHWSADDVIEIALANPPWYEPGTNWSYSHANFHILGQALEAAAGQGVKELIADRVIEPLELTGTDSFDTPFIPEPVLHSYSSERGPLEEATYWNPSWSIAAGAVMTSTLCDVLRSAEAIGTGELISDASYDEFVAPDLVGIGGPTDECPDFCREQTEDAYYGLGIVAVRGWLVQNPAFHGYGAVMAYHPPTETAVAIATTQGAGTEPSVNIADAIFRELAPILAQPGDGTASADDVEPAFVPLLRPQIEQVLDELLVPGAVVLIRNDDGEWLETFGTRDIGGTEPIAPEDAFRVGSNTKTMTGTVVLQLVDEGAVSLEDPIAAYVAGVPGGDSITIADLMAMSSGLASYTETEEFNAALDADPRRVWDPRELAAGAFSEPPVFAPGAGFHYSNTNTVLLGQVIEDRTGNSVEEEFAQRIFRPLGLDGISLPSLDDSSMPAPAARGYMYGTNIGTLESLELSAEDQAAARDGSLMPTDWTEANPGWGWTAGAAIANAPDLARYVEALVAGNLVSDELQQLRLDSLVPIDPTDSQSPTYGLALTGFGPLIGHDGSLPGYQSFMGHDPETATTVVVLCNLTAGPDGRQPANEIAKAIIGGLYAESASTDSPAE